MGRQKILAESTVFMYFATVKRTIIKELTVWKNTKKCEPVRPQLIDE